MAGFHFNLPDAKKGLFRDAATRLRDRMARAMQLAVASLMAQIKQKGDADIKSSGNFSNRWTRAFTVSSLPPVRTPSDRYVISIFFNQTIPYAHIHEFGGTIRPKGGLGSLFGPPLLWIPLSFGGVPKSLGPGANAGKMTAQEFGLQVSPLFRVNRKGKAPLLLDIKSRRPRYFGVRQVTLRQRFHIRDITKKEVAEFQVTFRAAVAATVSRTTPNTTTGGR